MKTSVRGLSLIASLAALAFAAPVFAAVYAPIEDAELLRRANTVVVARATGSTVVATAGGLPETRTTFTVIDSLAGSDIRTLWKLPFRAASCPAASRSPSRACRGSRRAPSTSWPSTSVPTAPSSRPSWGSACSTWCTTRPGAPTRPARCSAPSAWPCCSARPTGRSASAASPCASWPPSRATSVPSSTARSRSPARRPTSCAARPGSLTQVRQGGVSALWDDHWCPSGVPGSCGANFVRYRWVDPTATVRWCDEDPANFGQWGVAGRRVERAPERRRALGERPEQPRPLQLRRSRSAGRATRPRFLPPGRCRSTSTTCRCSAESAFPCPFIDGWRPRHERRRDRPVVARLQGDVLQDHPRGHRLGPPRGCQLPR